MTPLKKRSVYPWLQIAGLTVAVSVLGMLSAGRQTKQRRYYAKELREPEWAPPGWVFAPAWTINNIFLIKALMRLLDKDETITHRKKLLVLQGIIWINFFSFGYAFFKKRSPWAGAAITQADAVAALASLLVALGTDKKLGLHYLPLTVWTWFASSIAWYTALKNPDQLLNTKALLR